MVAKRKRDNCWVISLISFRSTSIGLMKFYLTTSFLSSCGINPANVLKALSKIIWLARLS
jgi:cellobiose-specific phosphotransferase system component IIC